jgi:arylsulfatase
MVRSLRPVIVRGPIALLLLASLTGCAPESSPPRLLLLISVDTLRADRLGGYGSDLALTPNLDALARQSLVFEAAYAPTSFTLPSIGALLTGRYPEEIGLLGNRSALAPSVPTLANELGESGWRSAAVVGNLVLRRNAGLAHGFDDYDDDLPAHESARGWPERIARDTTDAALAKLADFPARADDRLFLWVHYQDPHGPYTPPEGLRERFIERERERDDGRLLLPTRSGGRGQGRLPAYQDVDDQREVAFYRAGYDAEVHYLDAEVGRLLRGLEERALADRAVVVFTADHGESLGERDYWFAHGDRLDDALVRVPLLLRAPAVTPTRRHDIASLVDVHPTLVALATGKPPDPTAPGRDLLADGAGASDSEPYLATLAAGGPMRLGIVADGHKLVLTRTGPNWQPELFRIGYEDRNLVDEEPERVRELSERLGVLRRGLRMQAPATRQQLSEQDQRNLRSLGYIDAPETPPAD